MMHWMSRSASITAFPWGNLERVPRVAARNWGRLQRSLSASSASLVTPLARALGHWLQEPVRFEWNSLHVAPDELPAATACLRLRVDPGPIALTLHLDSRLVTRLVAFALKHEGTLYDPRQPPNDALLGAVAAIIVKLIEDAQLGLAVEFIDAPLQIPDAARAQIEARVHIDATAYRLGIGVAMSPLLCNSTSRRAVDCAELGQLPLGLPLVVGTSLVTREVLAELAPGKAFLSGSGLWVDGAGAGRGVLTAPLGEHGIAVDLEPQGRIVLRDANVTLDHDKSASAEATPPEAASIGQALCDAPVVLRIELGAVSLPARQWAELRVGDIIETGKPLGTEVTLRVAGQALAQGELLNIDGELGVRITKLLSEET
jgi:flagellar motor switch/type III secretory pathway protein FliN